MPKCLNIGPTHRFPGRHGEWAGEPAGDPRAVEPANAAYDGPSKSASSIGAPGRVSADVNCRSRHALAARLRCRNRTAGDRGEGPPASRESRVSHNSTGEWTFRPGPGRAWASWQTESLGGIRWDRSSARTCRVPWSPTPRGLHVLATTGRGRPESDSCSEYFAVVAYRAPSSSCVISAQIPCPVSAPLLRGPCDLAWALFAFPEPDPQCRRSSLGR